MFDEGICGYCQCAWDSPIHTDRPLPVDTDPEHHYRRGAPSTSRQAAELVDVTEQCRRVLGSYAPGDAITDHEAYERAGLTVAMNGARARCSDLRHAFLIEWTGDDGVAPSGRPARLSRITDLGREYLGANPAPGPHGREESPAELSTNGESNG
jgi:hypothetical protein